jgi:hypothetical protein
MSVEEAVHLFIEVQKQNRREVVFKASNPSTLLSTWEGIEHLPVASGCSPPSGLAVFCDYIMAGVALMNMDTDEASQLQDAIGCMMGRDSVVQLDGMEPRNRSYAVRGVYLFPETKPPVRDEKDWGSSAFLVLAEVPSTKGKKLNPLIRIASISSVTKKGPDERMTAALITAADKALMSQLKKPASPLQLKPLAVDSSGGGGGGQLRGAVYSSKEEEQEEQEEGLSDGASDGGGEQRSCERKKFRHGLEDFHVFSTYASIERGFLGNGYATLADPVYRKAGYPPDAIRLRKDGGEGTGPSNEYQPATYGETSHVIARELGASNLQVVSTIRPKIADIGCGFLRYGMTLAIKMGANVRACEKNLCTFEVAHKASMKVSEIYREKCSDSMRGNPKGSNVLYLPWRVDNPAVHHLDIKKKTFAPAVDVSVAYLAGPREVLANIIHSIVLNRPEHWTYGFMLVFMSLSHGSQKQTDLKEMGFLKDDESNLLKRADNVRDFWWSPPFQGGTDWRPVIGVKITKDMIPKMVSYALEYKELYPPDFPFNKLLPPVLRPLGKRLPRKVHQLSYGGGRGSMSGGGGRTGKRPPRKMHQLTSDDEDGSMSNGGQGDGEDDEESAGGGDDEVEEEEEEEALPDAAATKAAKQALAAAGGMVLDDKDRRWVRKYLKDHPKQYVRMDTLIMLAKMTPTMLNNILKSDWLTRGDRFRVKALVDLKRNSDCGTHHDDGSDMVSTADPDDALSLSSISRGRYSGSEGAGGRREVVVGGGTLFTPEAASTQVEKPQRPFTHAEEAKHRLMYEGITLAGLEMHYEKQQDKAGPLAVLLEKMITKKRDGDHKEQIRQQAESKYCGLGLTSTQLSGLILKSEEQGEIEVLRRLLTVRKKEELEAKKKEIEAKKTAGEAEAQVKVLQDTSESSARTERQRLPRSPRSARQSRNEESESASSFSGTDSEASFKHKSRSKRQHRRPKAKKSRPPGSPADSSTR